MESMNQNHFLRIQWKLPRSKERKKKRELKATKNQLSSTKKIITSFK
jgi:hypothetical protein